MNEKYRIWIICATILFLSCFAGTASARTWSVDDSGGANFTRIQDAINNASIGDTILVYTGVYYENVVVDKSVTLRGIGHPVVDARWSGNAVTLTADEITLERFDITNAEGLWMGAGIMIMSNKNNITGNNVCNNNCEGIYLWSSNNIITGNNVCNNNGEGIYLWGSSNNIITGNNVCYNKYGIELSFSYNDTITGNNVCHNDNGGISLYFDSSNNTITGNTFVNDGLFVQESYQNTVEDNTVNGRPLVYLEDTLDYKVKDAGQVILVNCSNITVENLDLTNTSVGIELWNTEDSRISNNKVSNNKWGIRLESSGNNSITDNTVCNNDNDGICLESSSNNFITGNNVSNNMYGIILGSSSNNIITGTTVGDNGWAGIRLSHSSNNIIRGNNFSNNPDGIYFYDSSNNNTITGNTHVNDGLSVSSSCHNVVEENTVNGKSLVYLEDTADYKVEDAGQVILVNCSNITVENLDLTNTSVGIELLDTEGSTILNNTVSNNSGRGIRLESSSNNTITGNTVCNNDNDGIRLKSSSNNSITGNNVSNNSRDGIRLSSSSSNNNITGNNVSNNSDGIPLYYSGNNISTGNTFVNGGLFVKKSYHNAVEENTVNGKPLVYLEDTSDYKVEDAGQVILVNCSNITVENLDLTNTSVGVELWNTEDSTIANNKVCNNSRHGIYFYNSGNNTITSNTVCHNYDNGIDLSFSSNSKIYFNNFINNTDNVDSYKSTNIWNSPLDITYTYDGTTYKSYLGNYWADYEEKYPDAEEIDSTGIWDTPYSVYEDKDSYPLMEPRERYLLYRLSHKPIIEF